MKALEIGCFWFASRRFVDEETFEPQEHLDQMKDALESVDNVSDIDIDADHISIAGWSFYPSKDDRENYFPMYAGLDISFKIYLPQRVQQTYGGVVSGEFENFDVRISYGYEFPIACISYDLPDGANDPDASTAVMVVRKYLSAKLQDNEDIDFSYLGPSPFHANILIMQVVGQDECATCKITSNTFGYDHITVRIESI